jgi:hypothetical protein
MPVERGPANNAQLSEAIGRPWFRREAPLAEVLRLVGGSGSRRSAAVLGNTFAQLLVNLAKLGVNRLLSLNVLSVQAGNQLGIRLLAVVVRMVAPTQIELPTRSLVVTHSPTAGS